MRFSLLALILISLSVGAGIGFGLRLNLDRQPVTVDGVVLYPFNETPQCPSCGYDPGTSSRITYVGDAPKYMNNPVRLSCKCPKCGFAWDMRTRLQPPPAPPSAEKN